ncbi:MAG TPA: hypothetical protein VJL39_00325 [Candidatus Paceibacterota bacterium]
MKRKYQKLTRDELADVVRALMADGGSYSSVADDLGTTRGMVAGICRDKHIPSTHSNSRGPKAKPAGEKRERKAKAPKPPAELPEPESETPEVPLNEEVPETVAPTAVVAKPPVQTVTTPAAASQARPPRLAASEFTRCKAPKVDSRPCEYARMDNSDFCPHHQHLA